MRRTKKHRIIGFALAVMFCCILLTGCVNQMLSGDLKFCKVWYAADINGDELYGNLEDGAWVANTGSLAAVGYIDVTMLEQKNVKLKKGLYCFEVNMSIDNNILPAVSNIGENDIVATLRIAEAKTGDIIAYKEIYRHDFTKQGEYVPIKLTFSLPYAVKVNLEAKYLSRATLTYDKYSVYGIKPEEHLRMDIEGYFAESEADKLIEYDTEAMYYFDLYEYVMPVHDSRVGYDIIYLVTALQGIVNRDSNALYIRFNSPNAQSYNQDEFWLDYLMKPGKFLHGAKVVTVERPATLLRLFKTVYAGLAVWDERVPATSNVAATAAGVNDFLPVRHNTEPGMLYTILTEDYGIPVRLNLVGKFANKKKGKIADTGIDSTGSAKNDAYLWAKVKYMDTAKVNPVVMSNHLDAFTWDKTGKTMTYYNLQQQTLANKDYYIKERAFFWDLNIWEDTIPNDDRGQKEGTDYKTFDIIMSAQNHLADGKLVTLGGFVPWWIKYTDKASAGLPGDVATEWKMARELGKYYMVKDADAYGYTSLANASIYCKAPKPAAGYKQKAKISDAEVAARAEKYFDAFGNVKPMNYTFPLMLSYDAGAWLNMAMPLNFTDPNRGAYPMAWPVNMGPATRVPHVIDFMYENQGENDFFVGDHNGYGYLELAMLGDPNRPAHLKGSIDSYFELTKKEWEYYDLSIMGFLLSTIVNIRYSDKIEKLLGDIAYNGLICNATVYRSGSGMLIDNNGDTAVPWGIHYDFVAGSSDAVINSFNTLFSTPDVPIFMASRNILKSPTFIKEIFSKAQAKYPDYNIEVVDPYVYMYLLKSYLKEGSV